MQYYVYQFVFQGDVHFGNNSLDYSEPAFCADTLFSALCQEAVKQGSDILQALVTAARRGDLLLSDALPYIGRAYFLPKPLLHITRAQDDEGNSVLKKVYKKMSYLPAALMAEYLAGTFPTEQAAQIDALGRHETRTKASIRGEEETMPYRVGVYRYTDGAGLYIIAGCGNEAAQKLLESLLAALGFSGIGGERSSGLGRFAVTGKLLASALPGVLMEERLTGSYQTYMTLSVSLPRVDEMEGVLQEAHYLLSKRSGFVSSERYAPEYMRKKDLYVFQAGSCFTRRFQGDVYDVSSGGAHPVYRYAKPLMLGVV